jgi:uncharacterized protein involved in outer membrane biogenesis
MKKVIRVILVLFVLLVLALVVGAFFLGSIVKKGVETVGPKLTQVEVKLDSARFWLLRGQCTLQGLFVGNPKGFDSPFAIRAKDISVSVQPGSVLSDKLVVRSVRMEGPEITLHGLGGDNLRKILDNVKASTGGGGTATPATKESKPAQKIEVDDFLITDGKLKVVMPLVGIVSVALPEVHLTDLGKGSGGLTPDELASRVLQEVIQKATAAAANAAKGATDAGKQMDKVTKGIGGLLGK